MPCEYFLHSLYNRDPRFQRVLFSFPREIQPSNNAYKHLLKEYMIFGLPGDRESKGCTMDFFNQNLFPPPLSRSCWLTSRFEGSSCCIKQDTPIIVWVWAAISLVVSINAHWLACMGIWQSKFHKLNPPTSSVQVPGCRKLKTLKL